jgi:hypothetical protein
MSSLRQRIIAVYEARSIKGVDDVPELLMTWDVVATASRWALRVVRMKTTRLNLVRDFRCPK